MYFVSSNIPCFNAVHFYNETKEEGLILLIELKIAISFL